MKRFIIILDGGDREKRNAITSFLQAKGWYLWHHMEDVWLVTNVPALVNARSISEEISKIPLIGGHPKLVMRVPDGPSNYWGNAPKDAWEWMSKFWQGDPA
jgi:hypothetical protein